MAGKYAPLERYLLGLPASQKEADLSFARIEEILKFNLPASAYEDDRWWMSEKEGNHVNARAWTSAGWKVERVDVNKKHVKLVRI